MGWLSIIFVGTAGLATMRAAIDRGDIDEAARQGNLAGPAVIERALAAPDRAARLAAIAAAPTATDLVAGRADLLGPLAVAAAQPDRRTAIPAARAARTIARSLYGHARPLGAAAPLPDDLAPADVAAWRLAWAELAASRDRWIELRVLALDTAAALDPDGIGVALGAALADADPAYRRAALALVPMPVPAAMRSALAGAVAKDTDPDVALDAAATLCTDLAADPPRPILESLGASGLERIRSLVGSRGVAAVAVRNAARCLAADRSPESAAALKTIRRDLK